jgi:N-methylhydantoinase A
VTDAALILGWLNAAHPLADDLPLDPALARRAVERVARAAGLTLERCAEGIVDVATAAMVRALRRVSVERGTDPRRMTLVPFGGAGPLFACRLAESLGMRRALVPRHPGVLSALGLAAAPERLEFVESFHRPAAGLDAAALDAAYRELEAAARAELPGGDLLRFADCRYPGQGYELTVPVAAAGPAVADAFHQAHRERYGHADPARAVEVVNLRLVARRAAVPPELRADGAEPVRPRGGRVPLDRLAPGTALRGPLMLDGVDATARIEPGWRGTVHASGTLVLERA